MIARGNAVGFWVNERWEPLLLRCRSYQWSSPKYCQLKGGEITWQDVVFEILKGWGDKMDTRNNILKQCYYQNLKLILTASQEKCKHKHFSLPWVASPPTYWASCICIQFSSPALCDPIGLPCPSPTPGADSNCVMQLSICIMHQLKLLHQKKYLLGRKEQHSPSISMTTFQNMTFLLDLIRDCNDA